VHDQDKITAAEPGGWLPRAFARWGRQEALRRAWGDRAAVGELTRGGKAAFFADITSRYFALDFLQFDSYVKYADQDPFDPSTLVGTYGGWWLELWLWQHSSWALSRGLNGRARAFPGLTRPMRTRIGLRRCLVHDFSMQHPI
jgi:hypothetical protein